MRIVIIFFALFVLTTQSFCQSIIKGLKNDSVKLVVTYTLFNNYVNDSVYSSAKPCTLYLGKEGSVCIIELLKMEDFLKQGSAKGNIDPKLKEMVESQVRNSDRVKKSLLRTIVRQNYSPVYYTYQNADGQDVLLVDTALYKWNLTGDYKMIDQYKCQKGVLKDNPNIWAWFTEQIPIPSGPERLYGLPGLILEYHNNDSKVCYKVSKISSENIPTSMFKELNDVPIITKAEYKILAQKDKEKVQRLERMLQTGKVDQNN